MKTISVYMLCCVLFTGCASSLPNIRTPEHSAGATGQGSPPDSSGQYYKISFFAYNRGTVVDKGKKSIAGHASISIDRMGTWGFHPAKDGRPITKNGILKYSEEYPRTQEYADFLVDENVMHKIKDLITEWKTNPPPYIIPLNDCVSFIYRICDVIRIRYNHLALLPIRAVREIRGMNDQNKLYESY
jgi:hypothetical protein